MSDLIQENNKQLMDSFKDSLAETVGQIKRTVEYLADQQMKEIKKLKYNEPRKFKKANEDQFQRIHSAELCDRTTLSTFDNISSLVGTPASISSAQMQPQPFMSNVPVFAFSSTQCRDLFCLWKAFLLPDDRQAKHPKLLNG